VELIERPRGEGVERRHLCRRWYACFEDWSWQMTSRCGLEEERCLSQYHGPTTPQSDACFRIYSITADTAEGSPVIDYPILLILSVSSTRERLASPPFPISPAGSCPIIFPSQSRTVLAISGKKNTLSVVIYGRRKSTKGGGGFNLRCAEETRSHPHTPWGSCPLSKSKRPRKRRCAS